MARRKSRAPLIAAVDMFVCFACVLFVILGQPQVEIDRQIREKTERLAVMDTQLDAARKERKTIEEEHAKRVAKLEGEILSAYEQLAQRQKDFQSWDIVVDTFIRYAHVPTEPKYHFYLRRNGIYSSTSSTKWTTSGLEKWLKKIASEIPDGQPVVMAMYVENGANDWYLKSQDILDRINTPTQKFITYHVTLPSGVRAGPDEQIHADKRSPQ